MAVSSTIAFCRPRCPVSSGDATANQTNVRALANGKRFAAALGFRPILSTFRKHTPELWTALPGVIAGAKFIAKATALGRIVT